MRLAVRKSSLKKIAQASQLRPKDISVLPSHVKLKVDWSDILEETSKDKNPDPTGDILARYNKVLRDIYSNGGGDEDIVSDPMITSSPKHRSLRASKGLTAFAPPRVEPALIDGRDENPINLDGASLAELDASIDLLEQGVNPFPSAATGENKLRRRIDKHNQLMSVSRAHLPVGPNAHTHQQLMADSMLNLVGSTKPARDSTQADAARLEAELLNSHISSELTAKSDQPDARQQRLQLENEAYLDAVNALNSHKVSGPLTSELDQLCNSNNSSIASTPPRKGGTPTFHICIFG